MLILLLPSHNGHTWNDYSNPMRDALFALVCIAVVVIVFWISVK
jgi:hypothetical protein